MEINIYIFFIIIIIIFKYIMSCLAYSGSTCKRKLKNKQVTYHKKTFFIIALMILVTLFIFLFLMQVLMLLICALPLLYLMTN